MVIDLNRVLMYADKNGHIRHNPVRRMFCIVDGIIGGEGNGPLDPTPKPAGVVLAGTNPVAVDLMCVRLMGFDFIRLPMLYRALENHPLPLAIFEYEDVVCRSNTEQFDRSLSDFYGINLSFNPHFGWRGHIELRPSGISEVDMKLQVD
jgi:hypothetical protein